MKNQSAPCQGVKCPKGYRINGNCTCTKIQDDSKIVKGNVKEISKEEYNKIRGFKNGGTMKTKMKKYGDGGTKASTRRIQANPIAEANRLKAYPTTKVSKVRATMQSGGTSGGYPTSGGDEMMQKGGTSLNSKQVKRKVTQNMIAPKKGTVAPQPQKMVAQKGGSMKPPVKAVKKKKPSPEMQKKIDRTIWQQGQGWGQNQTMSLKTGGMVNPNAKMQAQNVAGSKGVKSGVNPKAAASTRATGRSGGTSVAPKTAMPKAKYGMTLKKKQDGGPQDYVDKVIAQKIKSAAAQKGMNQARVAAKKGRAGKI